MSDEVIVVGGGLAGLACAVALGDRGVRVTVLESRPRLGGRASSFQDQATGTLIDNCQHVSMGCCTNFQHFCETVGIADVLETQKELYFIGRDGQINSFAASWLPTPLHLTLAFRRLSYLSKTELKMIQRGLFALAGLSGKSEVTQPFSAWLQSQQQSDAVIEKFWHVVLVSALSESLDRIETLHARKVFYDGFLAHRRGWEVQIPTVPLGEFYGPRLEAWLMDHNVSIRLKAGVARIDVQNNQADAVELRSGERLSAEQFVLAVPQTHVRNVLPEHERDRDEFVRAEQLEFAPISSVHLWFDRPPIELPHAVLIDRFSQWLFNRTRLQAHAEPPSTWNYQVVISASRNLDHLSQEEIVQTVMAELTEIWPAVGDATLVNSRVVTEHRAVFSVTPGSDALRPPQQSSIENLQLAGDWTQTGWPATMEGAVRSGYLAAENILAKRGTPARVVQPDLPVGRLTRLLFGGKNTPKLPREISAS